MTDIDLILLLGNFEKLMLRTVFFGGKMVLSW